MHQHQHPLIITCEICLSFLDHLIEGLNTRFDKNGSMIHKMQALVQSVIGMGKLEGNNKIEEIIHEYRDDLPTLENAFEEYSRWKRRLKAIPKEGRPDSVAKVLKVCDVGSYPNIYVLLKLLGTVGVTCECERSGSVLKRLNTYLRASMGQNRLSTLALVHINLNVDIDAKRVLKIFCKRDRAVEFTNIYTSNIA